MSSGPGAHRVPKVGSEEPEGVGEALLEPGFAHSQPMEERGSSVGVFSH